MDSDYYLDVTHKDSSPVRSRIYEAVNRHIVLKLHLQLSRQIINKKEDGINHIIREVQRIVSQVIETGDSLQVNFKLFDEISFYESLQNFFSANLASFKTYPK